MNLYFDLNTYKTIFRLVDNLFSLNVTAKLLLVVLRHDGVGILTLILYILYYTIL